jgi:uncharacterized membrane protein
MKSWYTLFKVWLALRVISGVVDILVGTFVFITGKEALFKVFIYFTRAELLEDPNDALIRYIGEHFSTLPNGTIHFAALYILAHGILNIFLSIQIYRHKIWAYSATIVVMIFFVLYQMYRISYTHSIILSLITLFDCLFILLTWRELKYDRKLI